MYHKIILNCIFICTYASVLAQVKPTKPVLNNYSDNKAAPINEVKPKIAATSNAKVVSSSVKKEKRQSSSKGKIAKTQKAIKHNVDEQQKKIEIIDKLFEEVLRALKEPIINEKTYDSLEMIISNDSVKYIGYIQNKKANGYGYYKILNGNLKGSEYIGNFVNGKKNGKGTFTYMGGYTIYDGYWSNDLFSGFGTLTVKHIGVIVSNCPNCKIYVGYWKNGLMDGIGKCYDKINNLLYDGDFKDGKPTDMSKYKLLETNK